LFVYGEGFFIAGAIKMPAAKAAVNIK